jgi:hypothetical protein
MAENFPGPYGLRLFYTTNGYTHKTELSLDVVGTPTPGTTFDNIQVEDPDSNHPTLDTVTDGLALLWKPLYDDGGTSLDRAELWVYEAGTYNATFISSYEIAEAGTEAVQDTVIAGEAIFTFRTQGGSTLRLHLEESIIDAGPSRAYAALSSDEQDLVDYLLSDDSPFIGRDNTRPIAFLKVHPGHNEASWKRIYR